MRKILTLCALVLTLLTGCRKNEFTVDMTLPATVNRAYTFLYYASDPEKGWLVENVASVEKGRAVMKGIMHNPCLVYLFGSGKLPQAVFYVERGDEITITGDGDSPVSWGIHGNKITDRLTAWRLENRTAIQANDASKINAGVARYVKERPDDPVSTILMLVYYDRRLDEAGFDRCWASLSGDAKDAEWSEICSRSDMLAELPRNAEFPSMVVLKTASTGCDTVRKGRVPMLFYFTRNTVESHDEDIKKIRRLSDEYPDSAGRIIVDVNFEPDSGARTYRMKRDSVRNAVRAWMPLGVNDETAASLGVARVPYEIVVDAKGKVVYRGDDFDQALTRFRREMK